MEEGEASNTLEPNAKSRISNVEHQEDVAEQSEDEADNLHDEPKNPDQGEKKSEPTLARCVRRHHKPEKIIGHK